jgi:hypothetical protein
MLQTESVHEHSKADALAIDALFRRLAERGRKIRLQRQAINTPSLDEATVMEEQKDTDARVEGET